MMLFSILIAQVNKNSGAYGAGQVVGTIILVLLIAAILAKVLGFGRSSRGGYVPPKPSMLYDEPRKKRKEPRAPTLGKEEVASKAQATQDLLRLVHSRDNWFDPAYLKEAAKEVFAIFQNGWDAKNFEELRGFWTAECRDKFLDRYEDSQSRKKMARLQDYDLVRVEHIHFHARGPENEHTFTVLVTAKGEEKWQEFWTFARTPKRWKLAQMRSTKGIELLAKPVELPDEVVQIVKKDPSAKHLLSFVSEQ